MALDYVVTRFVQHNVSGLRRDLATIAADFTYLESHIDRTGNTMARAAAVSTLVFGSTVTLASKATQAWGQTQKVLAGFETILGNRAKAVTLLNQVRQFDLRTPFTWLDTALGAQRLLAAGFSENGELMQGMEALGNAVVAAGGDTQKFLNLIRVLSQIKVDRILHARRMWQFAASGINIKKILQRELGLTDDQMVDIGKLKLKADVVIPAIIKGLNEDFAGGIEKARHRILGAQENLKGSTEKMLASIGKSFDSEAVAIVDSIAKITDAVTAFTDKNPELVKTALLMTGVGSAAVGFYAIAKAAGYAKLVTEALTTATNKDVVAEKVKSTVAVDHAAGLNRVAREAKSAARETQLLEEGLFAGVEARNISTERKLLAQMQGRSVVQNAGRTGAGRSLVTGTFVSRHVANYEAGLAGQEGRAAKALHGRIRGRVLSNIEMDALEKQAFRENAIRDWLAGGGEVAAGTAIGRQIGKEAGEEIAKKSAIGRAWAKVAQWGSTHTTFQTWAPSGGATRIPALGQLGAQGGAKQLGLVTRGGAALSGMLGLGAGVGVSSDLQSLGWSKGKANTAGAATGIAAAVASMFVPGAAIPIAIAMGFRYMFNRLVIEPGLRETERGNGLSPEDTERARNASLLERAQMYDTLAQSKLEAANKLLAEGARINDPRVEEYRTEAETFKLQARAYRRQAEEKAVRDAYQKRVFEEQAAAKERRLRERLEKQEHYRRTQDPNAPGPVRRPEGSGGVAGIRTKTRGYNTDAAGGRTVRFEHTVHLPPSDGDLDHRARHYQSSTPMPATP